jgi:hypothetical protein
VLRTLAFAALSPLVAMLAVLVPLATAFVDVRAYAALTKSGEGAARVDVIDGDMDHDCVDAVAWRDFVPAEQRLGSRVFTELELRRALRGHHYARATYVTSTRDDDGFAAMRDALTWSAARGCSVDLFFLENAGGEGRERFARALRDIGPRLRVVYDTGGGGARLASRWRDHQVANIDVVAHGTERSSSNVAPVFYVYFLAKLAGGVGVDDAVTSANQRTNTILEIVALAGVDVDQLWRDTRADVFSTSTRPTSPSRSTF